MQMLQGQGPVFRRRDGDNLHPGPEYRILGFPERTHLLPSYPPVSRPQLGPPPLLEAVGCPPPCTRNTTPRGTLTRILVGIDPVRFLSSGVPGPVFAMDSSQDETQLSDLGSWLQLAQLMLWTILPRPLPTDRPRRPLRRLNSPAPRERRRGGFHSSVPAAAWCSCDPPHPERFPPLTHADRSAQRGSLQNFPAALSPSCSDTRYIQRVG